MPLSEHEENVLAEIERQLAAEDPRFVARGRRRLGLTRDGQLRLGIGLAVVGIVAVLMLAFLASPWNFVVPGIGFACLLTGIILTVSARTAPSEGQQAFVPPDDRS
jgi:uncharacterized membrane protein HdeD (DUF308 family)